MTGGEGKPRYTLGQRLKEVRSSTGLSQGAFAKRLGFSQGKYQKLERGRTLVKQVDLEKIIDQFSLPVPVANELRRLHREATEQRREITPAYFREFLDAERRAERVRGWSTVRIPGLLQCEPLAIILFKLRYSDPDDIAELWRIRSGRREAVAGPSGSRHEYILWEGMFDWMRLSLPPEVYAEQLAELVSLLDNIPTLHLHILPLSADLPHLDPSFTVVTMPEGRKSFVFLEGVDWGVSLTPPARIGKHDAQWERLREFAYDRATTRALLAQRYDEVTTEARSAMEP